MILHTARPTSKHRTTPGYGKEGSKEHLVQPVTRFKRMCPRCHTVEGPTANLLKEYNDGRVECRNCMQIIPYFEVWDMKAQYMISKSWCCKHPPQYRKGFGILDGRIISDHKNKDKVRYSEATWDSVPGGWKPVNKYVCFQCLTVVTRRSLEDYRENRDEEGRERCDVTWSRPFLDSIASNLNGKTEKDTVEYPLTLDEYCELPYIINMHRDLQQHGALVIELNLPVHADTVEELQVKVKQEMKELFVRLMAENKAIPLPAGFEIRDGEVKRIAGIMGPAVPSQYQKFGKD
jgi:hypothetical protein